MKPVYTFHEEAHEFLNAQYLCELEGGNLVSIHSEAENALVAILANRRSTWIGLNDMKTEGDWMYTDGTSYDYSNWRDGEPSNSGGIEDCTEILSNGVWTDAPCTGKKTFVCKNYAPANVKSANFVAHNERKNWMDAEAACVSEGGHLASVYSHEERF